jgi:putative heme-binding domain-containing protein
LDWDAELLNTYAEQWDWQALSAQPRLPWTAALIATHAARWDWRALSANTALPWSSSVLQIGQGRWDEQALYRNPALPWADLLAPLVEANLNNPNNAVAEAALFAHQKLGLGGAQGKQIGTMKYEEVFAAVQKGGDAKVGSEMFLKAGCIACHTISPDEPPKGPLLSAVAKIYDRATLTESILKPSAKIAQGFESTWVKTKKGEQIEGFVTREGGDSVDIRNIVGQTVTVEKADVVERGVRPQSIMPEGLLNAFTTTDLQNLLAWLESLKNGK